MRRARSALAALAVVAIALACAATASAERGISVSETRITGTSRNLTFRGESLGGTVVVSCLSTAIAGTSASTIPKVEGARAGQTTSFSASLCTSNIGSVSVLAQLPWEGFYVAFLGTLPGITGLKGRSTVRFTLWFPAIGIRCTYEGSVYGLAPVVGGVITSGRILTEETALPWVEGGMLCPRIGTVEGEATNERAVTIRLI